MRAAHRSTPSAENGRLASIGRFLPLVAGFDGYDGPRFRGDVVAGLTTGVMLIPQGMGYAMLAGLPPIYGLYASLVPVAVYALLGTSRQLAVGPVAMVSLLVATGVSRVSAESVEGYVAAAVALALIVGVMQVSMGLLRLGFLVNFLSHPVISGFTSAAALIIGFSQLKHLLGIPLPRSHFVHEILESAWVQPAEVRVVTVAIGLGSIAILVGFKRWAPRFPRALLVVMLTSLLVLGLRLDERGVAIVGAVPAGLPPVSLPSIDLATLNTLWPIALTIALVGFMESIAVAKRYAIEQKYEVNANRELVALGLANMLGSLTAAYPVTGGFSRTAVNAQAGATSGVAGLMTALLIGLTLLLLTPLFFFLPKAVLAAIIMTAVFGLVDVHEVRHLWRVKRSDLAMWGTTFLSTATLGIEAGVLVGVGASMAVVILHSTRPHVALLGRLPGTDHFRNVRRYPEAVTIPRLLVVRIDSQFYFGNVNYLKETMRRLEADQPASLDAVVLDMRGVNRIDASAEHALTEILEDYRERGIRFVLTYVKGPVRDVLNRSGFFTELGEHNVFLDISDALHALSEEADELSSPIERIPTSTAGGRGIVQD